MALSNLMFAGIAIAGLKEWLFATTIIVDNFQTAFSSVAFVSFLTASLDELFGNPVCPTSLDRKPWSNHFGKW